MLLTVKNVSPVLQRWRTFALSKSAVVSNYLLLLGARLCIQEQQVGYYDTRVCVCVCVCLSLCKIINFMNAWTDVDQIRLARARCDSLEVIKFRC